MTENYQDSLEASRRRSKGWLTLGALLLGLMLFLCTCRDSRMIQADLWTKGRVALEAKGYDPNILSVSGRDATLNGFVATEDIKADAEAVVRGITGMRQVAVTNNLAVGDVPVPDVAVNNLAPTPALVPQRDPLLNVAVAAGTVTLSGLVGGGSRPQIIEAASELYGAANVVDNLEIADDVAEPNWLTGALGLLPQVKNELQEGTLSATPKGITLSGTALSEQASAGLSVAAETATGLEVNNNLVVATPDLKPATFAFNLTNGKAELNGTVPEATIAPAVEAASSAVGAQNVVNNLQVASDVAAPTWSAGLFGALPALAEAAPDLGLSVTDKNVTLTGTVSSPEARESVAKQVQDVVGADITVANQLQIAAQTPPQLRVKVRPDAVQLSGTVAQATADQAVRVAGTVSSTGSVVNQMTVAENVAQPAWLGQLIDYAPAYAKEIQEAELSVQGNTVTLVGAVANDALKTSAEENVRAAIGADPTLVNQLRVVAPVVEVQPVLNVKVTENAVTLLGNVAPDTATQLTQALTIPEVTLTNQLTTADNVAQPDWLPDVIGLIPNYKNDVAQAEIEVKDNTLTLAGTVVSDEKKIEVTESFESAVGESVKVVNNLQVEVAEPIALRVTVEDGVATLAGNLPSETAASVAASVDAAPDTSVTNEIQAASSVAVPQWLSNVVNLLPDVTSEVQDADVNIEGNTITLAGTVPSEEKKTEIAMTVSEAAGESVNVVNNLEVMAPAPSEPVQLRVQVQDGVAVVSGNVPEEVASQVTESVDAVPETTQVTSSTEAVPNVDVPAWLPNVIDVLPQVTADVTDADVNIVADTITLAGTAPTEERKTEIAATVAEAAGADVRVVNNLTVAPAEVAQAPEVTPEVEEAVTPEAVTPEPVTPEAEASPEVVQPTTVTRNPDVRIDIAGSTVRLTGTVPSAESVTAAAAPYQTETVENSLSASPDVANAPWLTKLYDLAPQVASDLNRASLVLSDTTLTVQGTAPSIEQRDTIGKYLSDALSPEITVINRLTVQVQIPNAEDGK
jgi:osmotically-inducible protein OsmY